MFSGQISQPKNLSKNKWFYKKRIKTETFLKDTFELTNINVILDFSSSGFIKNSRAYTEDEKN